MARLMLKGKQLLLSHLKLNASPLEQTRTISQREWIRKFREPDFDRKKLFGACEPMFAPDTRPDSDRCEKLTPLPMEEVHPYDKLLAEDLKRDWNNSRLICVLHRNSMTDREKIALRNTFQHQNMFLRYYNNSCVNYALTGTPYECLLQLFVLTNALLFCEEPQIANVLKTLKKTPHLVLMTAVLDNKIISVSELQKYSQLSSLQVMQAQFSCTLDLAKQSIYRNLNSPQRQLSMILDQHSKSKE